MLAGKLLNIVSELPEADILDSESWKSIVAGDTTTGPKSGRSRSRSSRWPVTSTAPTATQGRRIRATGSGDGCDRALQPGLSRARARPRLGGRAGKHRSAVDRRLGAGWRATGDRDEALHGARQFAVPPWTNSEDERLTRFERSPRSGRRRSPLASHPQLALKPTELVQDVSHVVDGQWSSAAGVGQVRRTDATVGAGVP